MRSFPLDEGHWLNPPVSAEIVDGVFKVQAAGFSDFWRNTSYGFVHDDAHALLLPFEQNAALEVSWILDYDQNFDQAGLFVFADERHWVKAGVEFSDGAPQLGAVVTNENSDWSVAPVPKWQGDEVHLRISRAGDALTIRARQHGEWKLVRLCYLDPGLPWSAGLFCASPSREGLVVSFTRIARGEADHSLH